MMMMKVMVNMVTTITNDNVSCLSDRRGSSTVHETRIAGTGGAATSLSHIHTNSFILIHHSLLCVQKQIFYVQTYSETTKKRQKNGQFSLG